jgi:hypothetical protein
MSDVEKMKESCLQIVAVSAVVVVLVELVNYFLSYRRATFSSTVTKLINAVRTSATSAALIYFMTILYQAKELAEIEDAQPAVLPAKATALKKDLKRLNTEMQQAKMLSTVTTAASMIMMFNWLSSSYGGLVTSRVPFEPMFPFKYLVRRGLEDDKPSPFDAGYALVFILSSQLFRCCLNRCMGVSLPSFAASTAGNWFEKMATDNRR